MAVTIFIVEPAEHPHHHATASELGPFRTAWQVLKDDAAFPKSIAISGRLAGKPWEEEIAVDGVVAEAGYLPRIWSKLEIDRLVVAIELAQNAGELELRLEVGRVETHGRLDGTLGAARELRSPAFKSTAHGRPVATEPVEVH